MGTLLDKARKIQPSRPVGRPRAHDAEELAELAIAYGHGEITLAQASEAIGMAKSNARYAMGSALIGLLQLGWTIVPPDGRRRR